MRHRVTSAFTAVACAFATAASAGKLISSWHDPSAGTLNFQKVLILVIAPHESQRQFGEVELSRLMKRTTGVPSYTVMTPADVASKETVLAFMARERFDGAVVMKFIGAAQEVSDPGVYIPTYSGFWDYYSTGLSAYRDPGYVRMARQLQMEVQVYSVQAASMKGEKLVWAGLSQTKNPDNAKELLADVVRVVAGDLKKHRLIN